MSVNQDNNLTTNPRYVAIILLKSILNGNSLTDQLVIQSDQLNENDRRFAQYLIFGTLRYFDELRDRVGQMLQKPIKLSEIEVELALLLAAYELTHMATAEYALINNWVNLIKSMGKSWASGLMNAILRNIQRKKFPLPKTKAGQLNLPNWLINRIELQWGKTYSEQISQFYKIHPQMTLRVNLDRTERNTYLTQLEEAGIDAESHMFVKSAIVLNSPSSVEKLPHFFEGLSTVQDASAQLAAQFLNPMKDEVILDACSAPGGKTTGILEYCSEIQKLVAIDSAPERLTFVNENIKRILGEVPSNVEIEAVACENYQPSYQFDKILLDVPCSATGIIHRHPDIKRLRKAEDIARLVETQQNILEHAWGLLKEGGRLLYVTCSILQDENVKQIQLHMQKNSNVKEIPLELEMGIRQQYGIQILPIYLEQNQSMDGFYYCLLEKKHE